MTGNAVTLKRTPSDLEYGEQLMVRYQIANRRTQLAVASLLQKMAAFGKHLMIEPPSPRNAANKALFESPGYRVVCRK